MSDEEMVDRHLAAVLDEVITAVQETKQAVWSASTADSRGAFDELQSFLMTKGAEVADAEQRIGGRNPLLRLPTGHQIPNLSAEAGGDHKALVALLRDHLRTLVSDVRERAAEIEGTPEAAILTELAKGVDERVRQLDASLGDGGTSLG